MIRSEKMKAAVLSMVFGVRGLRVLVVTYIKMPDWDMELRRGISCTLDCLAINAVNSCILSSPDKFILLTYTLTRIIVHRLSLPKRWSWRHAWLTKGTSEVERHQTNDGDRTSPSGPSSFVSRCQSPRLRPRLRLAVPSSLTAAPPAANDDDELQLELSDVPPTDPAASHRLPLSVKLPTTAAAAVVAVIAATLALLRCLSSFVSCLATRQLLSLSSLAWRSPVAVT